MDNDKGRLLWNICHSDKDTISKQPWGDNLRIDEGEVKHGVVSIEECSYWAQSVAVSRDRTAGDCNLKMESARIATMAR